MEDKWLKEGERYDDLELSGLKIIQDPAKFCFGMDAVLLSGFAKVKAGGTIVDFCTGTGIIPILLSAKTKAAKIIGVEIQEDSADMAKRSVLANSLEEKITIINDDLKNIEDHIAPNSVEVVTVNPPYMKEGSGIANPHDSLAIARHEISCNFKNVAERACRILKSNGHLYIVHRPNRLAELIVTLAGAGLTTKRIKFVMPYAESKPSLVLIDAVKGAKDETAVEEPIIVYSAPGEYSKYMKENYGY